MIKSVFSNLSILCKGTSGCSSAEANCRTYNQKLVPKEDYLCYKVLSENIRT